MGFFENLAGTYPPDLVLQSFKELRVDPKEEGFLPDTMPVEVEAQAEQAAIAAGESWPPTHFNLTPFVSNSPIVVTDSDYGIDRLDFTINKYGDVFDAMIQKGCGVRFKGGLSHYPETRRTLFQGRVFKKEQIFEDNGDIKLHCICYTPLFALANWRPSFPITYPGVLGKGVKAVDQRTWRFSPRLTIEDIVTAIVVVEHKLIQGEIKAGVNWLFQVLNVPMDKKQIGTVTQQKGESDWDFIQRLAGGKSADSGAVGTNSFSTSNKSAVSANSRCFMQFDEVTGQNKFFMRPVQELMVDKVENLVFRRPGVGYTISFPPDFNPFSDPDKASVKPSTLPLTGISITEDEQSIGEEILVTKQLQQKQGVQGSGTGKKPVESAIKAPTDEDNEGSQGDKPPPNWMETWEPDEDKIIARYGEESVSWLLGEIVSGKLTYEEVKDLGRIKVSEDIPSGSSAAPVGGDFPEAPDDFEDEGPAAADPVNTKMRGGGSKKGSPPDTSLLKGAQSTPGKRLGFVLTGRCPGSTFIKPCFVYDIQNLSSVLSQPGVFKFQPIEVQGHSGPWYLRKVKSTFTHVFVQELEFTR